MIRIGIVGGGFMARAHTLALNNLTSLYWPAAPQIDKVRLVELSESLASEAAARWGWREATTDWTGVTRADDIDLVDIVTPNDAHADIAIDAAAHGKHILCEKPLAESLASAQVMYERVVGAGVIHHVDFVYRSWPAVQLAKQLIDEGAIGRVMHFRGYFLQDYALDASLPMIWRMQRERAGSGSLGDTGSHLIDLARFLVGEVTRVFSRSRTFITERPDAPAVGEAAFRGGGSQTGRTVPVDVDDATDVLLEFEGSAIGVIQTNWAAAGHKIDLGFEVGGSEGAIRFSWTRANELELYAAGDRADTAGFRTIVVGPAHPGAAEFWPVAGQGLGYGDAFLIALAQLLRSVEADEQASPDFLDGLRAQEVIEAALRSDAQGAWVDIEDVRSAAVAVRESA